MEIVTPFFDIFFMLYFKEVCFNILLFVLEQDSKTVRINNIHALVHSLPKPAFQMLELLIRHLCKYVCSNLPYTVNILWTHSILSICLHSYFTIFFIQSLIQDPPTNILNKKCVFIFCLISGHSALH